MDLKGEIPALMLVIVAMFLAGLLLVFLFPPSISVSIPSLFWLGIGLIVVAVVMGVGARHGSQA